MFYVIGVGPGDPKYLTKAGADAISGSDVLVGAKRHLQSFATDQHIRKALSGENLMGIIEYIGANKDRYKISVLVSGDPCFFSFGNMINEKFNNTEYEVIPGISSVQLAFSKLKKPWDNAAFLSLHGRDIDGRFIKQARIKMSMFETCCFLGDRSTDPGILLDLLVNRDEYNAFILSDLSLPGEMIENINNKDKVELDSLRSWILVVEKR